MGIFFNRNGNGSRGLLDLLPPYHGLDPDGNVITAVINILGTGTSLAFNGLGSILKFTADSGKGFANAISPLTNLIPFHSIGDKIVDTVLDNLDSVGSNLGSNYQNRFTEESAGDRNIVQAVGDIALTTGQIVTGGIGSLLQFGADAANGLLNQGGPVGALLPNFIHSLGDSIINLGVNALQNSGDFFGGNYTAKYENHFDKEWNGQISSGIFSFRGNNIFPDQDPAIKLPSSRMVANDNSVDIVDDQQHAAAVDSYSDILSSGHHHAAENAHSVDIALMDTPVANSLDEAWATQAQLAVA